MRPMLLSIRFTTDGSGNPTVPYDYEGDVTVTKSGNNYIINIGPFSKLLACFAKSLAAASNGTVVDAAAGTVQVNFAAAVASSTVDIMIHVDTGFGT